MSALVALVLLAAVAPAGARAATQVIPGSGPNMTVYVGDDGALQALLPGMTQGMFYGADDGPASNSFYLRPTSGPQAGNTASQYRDSFVPVSNGPVTGNYTPASPAQVVTVFDVLPSGATSPIARVRQTTQYVGYRQRFTVHYEVTNTSGAPLQFIAGTAADLFIGANDSGTGIVIDGPRRFVGGTNTVSAKVGGLQELTASRLPDDAADVPVPRWASFGEDVFSPVVNRLHDNDAFTNTVNPAEVDNGVGVSWDDHATAALANGATARYAVEWVAEQTVPLRATPSAASVELPGSQDVVLTLSEADGDPVPGLPIRYRINGVGATPANPEQYLRAVTNDAGQVVVRLTGTDPGESTVLAFADVLGAENGVREAAEPQASAKVTWRADDHVAGPPTAPASLAGPSGSVPVGTVANPDDPGAPTYTFGRSASASAGFPECVFDNATGRQLNVPITVPLDPGGATISNASLLLVDPSRHDPNATSGATQPPSLTPTSSAGNSRTFTVNCVVNREMWVRFTLQENGTSETFVIPIGGLLLIDPQGVVYDRAAYDAAVAAGQSPAQARATAAIRGATVRLQRRNSLGAFVDVISGDPGISPRVNPQTTGADGRYQWDVAAGTYRVSVTAAGFVPVASRAVDIPPPVLDLHVPMERPSAAGGDTGTDTGGVAGAGATSPAVVRPPASVATLPARGVFAARFASGRKPLRVSSKRRVTVGAVTCPAGTVCPAATLTLRPTARGKGARRLPKVLGRVTTTAPAGGSAALTVQLSKATAKALKRRGRVRVRATLTGAGQPARSAALVIRG